MKAKDVDLEKQPKAVCDSQQNVIHKNPPSVQTLIPCVPVNASGCICPHSPALKVIHLPIPKPNELISACHSAIPQAQQPFEAWNQPELEFSCPLLPPGCPPALGDPSAPRSLPCLEAEGCRSTPGRAQNGGTVAGASRGIVVPGDAKPTERAQPTTERPTHSIRNFTEISNYSPFLFF